MQKSQISLTTVDEQRNASAA